MVGCGGNYREILRKFRVETSVTGKWIEYISILFQSIELSSISCQFQRLVLHTCILTYIILICYSYMSFPARVNPSTPRTRPTLWLPAQATAPTSLQVGDFVYFYSLVLQTIHRFHNQFSQSRRRPVKWPSAG